MVLLAAIFVVAIVAFMNCRNDKAKEKQVAAQKDTTRPANVYEGLRRMAFTITPEQLHLTIPAGSTHVYGFIMDWNLGEGIATLVAYETGDASLYVSSGGGIIGGGQHETVARAAKELLAQSQSYIERSTKTTETPVARGNTVSFYLLTNSGIFRATEDLDAIEKNRSPFIPLFNAGNAVITELRKTQGVK